MASEAGPVLRLFEASKRLLSNLAANSETRLRLAVLALEEERRRLVTLLLLLGSSLVMLLLGPGMLALLVVVRFWDSYLLTAIATRPLVLLAGGCGIAM